jgi:hypothetical protein
LPMPEPIPRPTRFLFEFAFFGARKFERFISLPNRLGDAFLRSFDGQRRLERN